MRARLCSEAGESIAETLISLLIASVALMMLAGMITSSARLINRSRSLMETYYSGNNVLETGQDASSGRLTITLEAESGSSRIQPETFSADYYVNEAVPGKPVISYRSAATP